MPITFIRRSSGPVEPKRKLERKFDVRLVVHELQCVFPSQDEGDELGLVVDVKWKGPKTGVLFSRKSVKRGRTAWQPASDVVAWDEEFMYQCILVPAAKASGQQGQPLFQPWDVHFAVRKASKGSPEKCIEVGTAYMDLANFAGFGDSLSRTEVFPVTPFHAGSDFQAFLKVTVQFVDISDDAELMDAAHPVRAHSEGRGSELALVFASSPWGSGRILKALPSDEEADDEAFDESKEKPAFEKGVKKVASMGRLSFGSLRGKTKTLQKQESDSQRLFDALDLTVIPPMYNGEETEDEDPSLEDFLKYGRIVGVNLAVSNSLPAVPPLLPLSASDSEESMTTSPRTGPSSPKLPEAGSASGANAAPAKLSGQGGRKFLGLTFGSSSKPAVSSDQAGVSGQVEEADEGSDTEDGPEGSKGGAMGLQIRVPGAVSGFSEWGVSVFGVKRKMANRSPKAMEEPLLNKAYGEEGGDEIDWDRRQAEEAELEHPLHQQKLSRTEQSEFDEELLQNVFGEAFSVGRWETREITNRDGSAKLRTDVFFASIDQCHERAAGGGACTSLVAMVAEWLHAHPSAMPNKAEFDDIIKDGSAEWRRLCEVEAYKTRFPDKHFDLETVLEARSGRLQVSFDRSYIGFFCPKSGAETLSFLDGAMTFDNILDEVEKAGPAVYILSWNDHFFVLVVATDKCYIVDTLGNRLYEGCRQAYVLQFDANSTLTHLEPPPKAPEPNSKCPTIDLAANKSETGKGKASAGKSDKAKTSKEGDLVEFLPPRVDLVEEKKLEVKLPLAPNRSPLGLCGQFMKEFFAAVPLRELEKDIAKGLTGDLPLHQRLQIEFHYTLPGNSCGM